MASATTILGQLLMMSSSSMGFLQYPTLQCQTNSSALLKHKHLLESSFLKASMTLHRNIQICYSKPNSTARDTRSLSLPALAVFHGTFTDAALLESTAVREGILGPCPLIS